MVTDLNSLVTNEQNLSTEETCEMLFKALENAIKLTSELRFICQTNGLWSNFMLEFIFENICEKLAFRNLSVPKNSQDGEETINVKLYGHLIFLRVRSYVHSRVEFSHPKQLHFDPKQMVLY